MRVRFINEKFAEETDPIKDMEIGMKFLYDNLEKQLREKFPNFISGFDNAAIYKNFLIVNDIKQEPIKDFFKNDLNFKFISLKHEQQGPYYRIILRFKLRK